MDVNLSAMDKLPLITILAMERANNNCYKNKFMGESYLPHKDNRICVLLVLLNNNFLFCFIGYTFVLTNLFVHTELVLGSDLSCYEKGRRCSSEILN